MRTGAKIGISAGILAALAALVVPKALKVKNAATNTIFNVAFNRVHSIKNGVVKLYFDSVIRNLSGFDIFIENLSVILESSKDAGKTWANFGSSPERILKVEIPDNKTTTTPIPVEVSAAKFLQSLAELKNKYRIVVNYDYSGLPMQYVIEQDMTKILKDIGAKIKKSIGLKGTEQYNKLF